MRTGRYDGTPRNHYHRWKPRAREPAVPFYLYVLRTVFSETRQNFAIRWAGVTINWDLQTQVHFLGATKIDICPQIINVAGEFGR